MDTTILVITSGVVTRQIIQEFKKRGWISNGLVILITTFLVNFVLAAGYAFYEGQTLSVTFFRSLIQAMISVFYHDLKSSATPPDTQVVMPVSVQTDAEEHPAA